MDGDFSLGGVIYCIEKELKSGSSISSFIPSAVTDTQRTPGQLTWAQPFTAPFICLSPIEEPSAGDRDAEHLRPPRLPRPPARAARAPREERTPDGRLDALLPGPHHGQRATRSSLPIRTSAAPRKRGPDTSGRGAPRGARSISSAAAEPRPGPPCSRARWREATNAPLRPPRLPRGAQRRPAALGTGKAVRRRRPGPPRTRHGEPAPPGAGQGRAAPRPAGPLGRPREVTPPLTTPPRPRDGPGPADGLPPAPLLRDRSLSRRRGIPAPALRQSPTPPAAAPAPTGGGSPGDALLRPAPRELLVAKSPTPGARRAPSNAAAPPTDVMETSASASRPPVAAAGGRGEARGPAPAGAVPIAAPPAPPPLKTPHVGTPLPRPREEPCHVTGAPQAARGSEGTGGCGAGRGGGRWERTSE